MREYPRPWQATTDELGVVDTREEPGRYRVWIGEKDAPSQTVDVVLKEGGTEEIVLRAGGS